MTTTTANAWTVAPPAWANDVTEHEPLPAEGAELARLCRREFGPLDLCLIERQSIDGTIARTPLMIEAISGDYTGPLSELIEDMEQVQGEVSDLIALLRELADMATEEGSHLS